MLVKSTRLLPAAEEGSVGFWSPVCEGEKRPKAHHQPDTSASGNLLSPVCDSCSPDIRQQSERVAGMLRHFPVNAQNRLEKRRTRPKKRNIRHMADKGTIWEKI